MVEEGLGFIDTVDDNLVEEWQFDTREWMEMQKQDHDKPGWQILVIKVKVLTRGGK
jgi:hypothetical protein